MTRVFRLHVVLGIALVVASGPRTSWSQQADAHPETLIRLSVSPAPAPRPALRFQLLPELKEMSPGNPIEGYFKCYLEQYRFVFDEQAFERRRELLAMPLEEQPGADSPELGRSALLQADRAARLDNPDWQVLLKLKADGFNLLLPDVQALRNPARALQVRFRGEVARGRVDDAIRTAKTMFAMSRHMGAHPTLIGCLVAISMANLAISPMEDFLEQPGCPNLYWALTNLPDPLIPIRPAMDGERTVMWALVRDLSTTSPMSAEQINKFIVTPLDKLFADSPQKRAGGIAGYLAALTKDEQKLSSARTRLVESGLSEANVNSFPPDQVILLDEARELQARFDEIVKTMVFPAWQFEALTENYQVAKREQAYFADAVLPVKALVVVRRAQARFEQRIALLRHVEALRMFAADHGGVFPAKLALVSVPLPDDPFTGKPFIYEASGKTAHLRGTPPSAEQNTAVFRIHYEITLRN
jgi:hypothetical protein